MSIRLVFSIDNPISPDDLLTLVLQDDRNLVLYSGDGAAWSSKTDTTDAPPAAPEAEAEVAPAASEEPAAPEPKTYTVVSGDTLFNLQAEGQSRRFIQECG